MDRLEAVKQIFDEVEDDHVVITSAGYISREVFHYRDRDLNFYVMGSMGSALAIGMGVALYKDTVVYVIQGDGSALMSLGSFATLEQLNLLNLYNCVLINGLHESTGGQKLAENKLTNDLFMTYSRGFWINADATVPPRIPLTPQQITKRFMNALRDIDDKKHG